MAPKERCVCVRKLSAIELIMSRKKNRVDTVFKGVLNDSCPMYTHNHAYQTEEEEEQNIGQNRKKKLRKKIKCITVFICIIYQIYNIVFVMMV